MAHPVMSAVVTTQIPPCLVLFFYTALKRAIRRQTLGEIYSGRGRHGGHVPNPGMPLYFAVAVAKRSRSCRNISIINPNVEFGFVRVVHFTRCRNLAIYGVTVSSA